MSTVTTRTQDLVLHAVARAYPNPLTPAEVAYIRSHVSDLTIPENAIARHNILHNAVADCIRAIRTGAASQSGASQSGASRQAKPTNLREYLVEEAAKDSVDPTLIRTGASSRDPRVSISDIFGLNTITDIQYLFGGDLEQKATATFEAQYATIVEGSLMWNVTNVRGNPTSGNVVGVQQPLAHITSMTIRPFRFPPCSTLSTSGVARIGRLSIGIQELFHDCVSGNARKYHWLLDISRPSGSAVDVWYDCGSGVGTGLTYHFHSPVRELTQLTLQLGQPSDDVTPFIETATVTPGATTTFTFGSAHFMTTGDFIQPTNLAIGYTAADAAIAGDAYGLITAFSAPVAVTVTGATTCTVAVDTSVVAYASFINTGTVTIRMISRNMMFQIEFAYRRPLGKLASIV
jgi:hypothetical protein